MIIRMSTALFTKFIPKLTAALSNASGTALVAIGSRLGLKASGMSLSTLRTQIIETVKANPATAGLVLLELGSVGTSIVDWINSEEEDAIEGQVSGQLSVYSGVKPDPTNLSGFKARYDEIHTAIRLLGGYERFEAIRVAASATPEEIALYKQLQEF